MTAWDSSQATAANALGANLGYELYNTKLGKTEAAGLYQPKGDYLTAHQSLADYVTLGTVQTITGKKTFVGGLNIRFNADTSNAIPLNWMAVDGTTVRQSIVAHNTAKRLILNPCGSSAVYEDAAGKYSLIVGVNELKYNTNTIWHAGNDGSGSGLDADLLDGRHGDGFLQNFAPESTATATVDANAAHQNAVQHDYRWSNTPYNNIGSLLDLTYSKDWRTQLFFLHTDKTAIGVRSRHDGTTWGAWRTIAFTDSHVASATSATKLQTPHNIWGRPFDGQGDVAGDMSNVGNLSMYGRLSIITGTTYNVGQLTGIELCGLGDDPRKRAGIFAVAEAAYSNRTGLAFYTGNVDTDSTEKVRIDAYGRMGIGTPTPLYALDVVGTTHTTELRIGSITLSDDGDGCLRIGGNVYSTGGMSAYGKTAASGGGTGSLWGLMTTWDSSQATAANALGANLGYELYNTKLGKTEAAGLYQPKGDYLTAITKAQVEGVLTGAISSHFHTILRFIDRRAADLAPYATDFTYNKGIEFGLKNNGIDGLSSTANYHSVMTLHPWSDTSGGAAHQLAFCDGNLYHRYGQSAWSAWDRLLTAANTYISDSGTIVIGSSRITPLTEHQSLAGYVKKTGDTMTGTLRVDLIQATSANVGLIGYKSLDPASWFAGAPDLTGIIRTGGSLLHRRAGIDYNILDSANFATYALPLSGGTLTGTLTLPYTGAAWGAMAANASIQTAIRHQNGLRHGLAAITTKNGNVAVMGGSDDNIGFYGWIEASAAAGYGSPDWQTLWNTTDGSLTHTANASIWGTLGVSGALNAYSTLNVSGTLTAATALNVGNNLTVGGVAQFNNTLRIGGADGIQLICQTEADGSKTLKITGNVFATGGLSGYE